MVEVPSGPISLWPPGSGARTLRAWTGAYGTQHGFTWPRTDRPGEFRETDAQAAFRHGLTAAAIYLETYRLHRNRGQSDDLADQWARATALGLGNLNELWSPNELPQHLKDFWNNYEGVLLGHEIARTEGADISNDRLAQIVAGEVKASIQAPVGE